jgi:hypothetical protein
VDFISHSKFHFQNLSLRSHTALDVPGGFNHCFFFYFFSYFFFDEKVGEKSSQKYRLRASRKTTAFTRQ